MADPQTTNVGFYEPTRGSDVGTWDQPVNANSAATDSLFSNVATIALSNANVLLNTPPNSGAAWAGPYQSQSGILRFTGILAVPIQVTLPRPGFWIVENLCTVGVFYVVVGSSAPGKIVGVPPGEATHVYNDGVDCKYVDLGRVGSYLDLATTAVPAWITASTVPPYLNCDGTTFSGTTYPALAALLGGTTLPDSRGRARASLNQTTSRITTAGSGVDGNTLFAAGGNQNQTIGQVNLPAVNFNVTDPGHTHSYTTVSSQTGTAAGATQVFNGTGSSTTGSQTTGISVASGGSGTALTTVPPAYVGGLTLIRAG